MSNLHRVFTRKRTKIRNVMTQAQEESLANKIAWKLQKTYPGHMWAVNVHQGVVTVKNMFLSGTMGFTVKISDLDKNMHKIVIAGGEILARYNLKRDKSFELSDIANKPKDFAGRIIHEV